MDTFRTSDLRKLTDSQQGPCVSIFMPTRAAGCNGQQDALRLKNLLGQAERDLVDRGMRSPDAKSLLAQARQLPDNPSFWEKRARGMAVFVSDGVFEPFRVPLELDEMAIVNRRFQVKPLLPLLAANDHFFVLALSQNQVRFLEGRRYEIRQVQVEHMPNDMEQALNYDTAQRASQVHSATRGDSSPQASAFRGQSGEREAAKNDLARYFRIVDAALHGRLRDQRAPLILAGVQYLLPIYREISSYGHIADDELTGNPDHLSEQELHNRAWPLIKNRVDLARKEADAKYRQLAGTGRTSADIRQVVVAAHQGQVESLFVDRGAQQWGEFDLSTGVVELHESARRNNDELLDYAVMETMHHRGEVFAVSAGQVPSPPVAAVFRY